MTEKVGRLSDWVGQKVRDRRSALRLTQSELATRTGISVSALSRIEQGQVDVMVDTLHTLAGALKTDIGYFVVGVGDKDRSGIDFGDFTVRRMAALYRSGRYEDLIALNEQASSAEYFKNIKNRIKLVCWNGRALFSLKRYDEVIAISLPMLEYENDIRDKYWVAFVYHNLAISYEWIGDIHSASTMNLKAENYLSTVPGRGSHELRIRILLSLSVIHNFQGRFEESKRYSREALELARPEAKQLCWLRGHTLTALSANHAYNGKPESGYEFAKQALRLFELAEDKELAMIALNNMAFNKEQAGSLDEAKELYERTYELALKHPEHVTPLIRKSLAMEGFYLDDSRD